MKLESFRLEVSSSKNQIDVWYRLKRALVNLIERHASSCQRTSTSNQRSMISKRYITIHFLDDFLDDRNLISMPDAVSNELRHSMNVSQ